MNDIKEQSQNTMVDIILVTYNHEDYIGQAIESILMQKCDFAFRIIVCDDKSTDSTVDIIKEYSIRFPELFIFLKSERNVGITKNYQRGFNATTSKYVAVLEGDDYWASPLKLKKQVDFLNKNSICSMCFTRMALLDQTKKIFSLHQNELGSSDWAYLNVVDIIYSNFIGNFSSCMYRRDKLEKISPEIYNMKSYDWVINIAMSQHGFIGYISEVGSVYRIHEKGTWSKQDKIKQTESLMLLIDEYNQFFNGVYHETFMCHKNRLKDQIINMNNDINRKSLVGNIIVQLMPPIVYKALKNVYQKINK